MIWLLLLPLVCLNVVAATPDAMLLRQPLHFEKLGDQHFRAHSPGYSLDLSPTGSRISTAANSVAIQFINATGPAHVEPEKPLPGVVNHLIGPDPAQWQTALATFERVRLVDVYPGIDVIFFGNGLELEYDIVVAPGASAATVAIEFLGADSVALGEDGQLLLRLGSTLLQQRAPFVYQLQNGLRVPVESAYALDANRVRFRLGAFDSDLPLTIDPVVEWSTYFGGTSQYELISDVAVDADGNIYVTGQTLMTGTGDLSLKNAMQDQDDPIHRDGNGQLIISRNAFISCFNSAGQLVFSTYLGGRRDDAGVSIAVGRGSAAGVYVTGWTASVTGGPFTPTTFPLTPGAYLTNKTEVDSDAIFLTKLTTAGQMSYSTLLFPRMAAGTSYEIDVDSEGRAYVGGYVDTGEFPGTSPGGGTIVQTGAFLFAFKQDGSQVIYGNYIGWLGRTLAIAVEPDGIAHVGGSLGGSNDGFQSTPNAFDSDPPFTGFGFYQKVAPDGSILYATRLKSLVEDAAVAADGNVLLAGGQAMLTKFDPSKPGGQALVMTNDFGGAGLDVIKSIDVDNFGNIFAAGHTDSADLPTVNPTQTNYAGGNDVFVAQLNPAGTGVAFLTYLGGSKNEPVDGDAHLLFYRASPGVAADPQGRFFVVAGGTDSPDFPLVAPFQGQIKGTTSGFIARFGAEQPKDALVVNSNNDVDDGACDTAHCSLREAIRAANEKDGVQTIEFNIPGQGVPTISPLTRLPSITQPVIIDGTTQPAAKLVEIEGSRITAPGVDGIQIQGNASTLRGLVINRFTGNGIFINGGDQNTITECRIGVDAGGALARANTLAGVLIEDGRENSIGRANAAPNIVSGNLGDGIRVRGINSHRNQVFGNFIGANPDGAANLGNRGDGVLILGGKGNRIGSELAGANVIGGNLSNGVTIATADAAETVVVRNYIGIRQGGTRIANLNHGVEVRGSARNLIGGSAESAFNFISGNVGNGILIDGDNSINNRIQGNIIGLIDTEVTAAPNHNGIVVNAGSETLIGGPVSRPGGAPGNVISGNIEFGIQIARQAEFTTVQGNVIGTDRGIGEARLQNRIGLRNESAGTQIGGPQAAHRNVISGNGGVGVILEANCILQGNYIGLNIAGNKGNLNGDAAVGDWHDLQVGLGVSAVIGGELPLGALPGEPPGNVIGGRIDLVGFRTRVLGNIIGADRTGTTRIGPGRIFVGGDENVIGSPLGANLVPGTIDIVSHKNIVQGNSIGVGLNGVKFDNNEPLIKIRGAGSGNLVGGRKLGEGNKLVGGRRAIDNASSQPNEFLGNEIRDFSDEGINTSQSSAGLPRIIYAGPFGGNNSGAVAMVSTDPIAPGETAELELFASPRLGVGGNPEAHRLLEQVILPQFAHSSNALISIPSFEYGQFLTATITRPGKTTSPFALPVAHGAGADSDQDGIPDALESTADGNKDGTPDQQQPRVATTPLALGNETMTLETPAGFDILGFALTNGPPIILDGPPVAETAGAIFSIRVQASSPDGLRKNIVATAAPRLSLTIFTSAGFRPNAWLMHGRTFENPDRHWHVFAYDGTSGAEILADRIILHIVDGEWEDERGLVDGIYEFTGTLARLGDTALRIEQFTPLSGGDYLLRWSGPLAVQLEQSANLQIWNSLIQTNFIGANPAIIFPANESDPRSFFRLRAGD